MLLTLSPDVVAFLKAQQLDLFSGPHLAQVKAHQSKTKAGKPYQVMQHQRHVEGKPAAPAAPAPSRVFVPPDPPPPPEPTPTAPKPTPTAPKHVIREAPKIWEIGAHVPDSRKELWWRANADKLREIIYSDTVLPLDEAEKQGIAGSIIKKEKLLGPRPSAEDLRASGHSAGGAFAKRLVWDAIGAAPPDNPRAREKYLAVTRQLWLAMRDARTAMEVWGALQGVWKSWDLNYRHHGAPTYEATPWQKHMGEVKDSCGMRLVNLLAGSAGARISRGSDAARKAAQGLMDAALRYDKIRFVHPAAGVARPGTAAYVARPLSEYVQPTKEHLEQAAEAPVTDPTDYMFERQPSMRDRQGRRLHAMGKPEEQDWSWAEAGKKKDGPAKPPKPKRYDPLEIEQDPPDRLGPPPPAGGVKALLDTYKLRGVQKGDYVSDDDLSHHARQAFVAFHDLADILGLPTDAVAYNGRLALAFGARGKGKAAAHYEPSLTVINLTRDSGGGTLAHEWGHFLDNMLARFSEGGGGMKEPFATHAIVTAKLAEDPHGELRAAMAKLMVAMHMSSDRPQKAFEREQAAGSPRAFNIRSMYRRWHSDYHRESAQMGSSYWTTPTEMFARAFEAYVSDKLLAAGRRNPYLVQRGRTLAPHRIDRTTGTKIYPYPRGKDRERINGAFDEFFGVLSKHKILAKALFA